jgi:hypothetical protein
MRDLKSFAPVRLVDEVVNFVSSILLLKVGTSVAFLREYLILTGEERC